MSTENNLRPEWVAVDWGTSNLRAWVIASDGSVLHQLSSDDGMGSLKPEQFQSALLSLLAGFLPSEGTLPVIASGMVGARQGWIEAPYAMVPCLPPTAKQAVLAPTTDSRLSVYILPGVAQARPADVMRGEETQIAGFIASHPDFDGVLCLPGTHSKWVRISAGEIVGFKTFMTGELFALLANTSVLRHSVQTTEPDDASFAAAVQDALAKPEMIAARLFSIRAGSLVADLPVPTARATLSGLLIGMELAGSRGYWLGMDVAIIGASSLAGLYQQALTDQGLKPTMTDTETITLAGLTTAYHAWKENL